MKSIICCVLALVIGFSMAGAWAVSADELTLEMIVDANRPYALLEKGDSFYIKGVMESVYLEYYGDDEVLYYDHADYDLLNTREREIEYRDGVYNACIYLEPQESDSWARGLFIDDPDEKKLTAVQVGGRMILKTGAFKGDAQEKFIEYTYVVDAQDLHALGYISAEHTADDMDVYIDNFYTQFGVERPAGVAEMMKHAQPAEDAVKFTLVMDPGTDKEMVCSVEILKGDGVYVYLDDVNYELMESFYLDPECTRLYEGGGTYEEDITLYQLSENIGK